MEINHIKEKIKDAGLKVTHPRVVVLNELVCSKEHPTAESIFDSISEANPSISLATVYRVLDVLADNGLVDRVSVKSGSKRYDANLQPHNHIYCTKTNQIKDFYNEELNDLINNFFEKKQIKNFKITDIKLQVNGERISPDEDVELF